MTIQFGGLSSGLDTNAIITALLAVQSRPIQLLGQQQDQDRQKLSLFGTLEGLVESLQEKAQELSGSRDFFAFQIDPSVEGVADFSLTGSPPPGSHTLEVLSLAQADRYAFDGLEDSDTTTYTGNISFDFGGTSYSVDFTDTSLDGIAAAINADAGDAVSASVVNVGTDQSPSYQLVLAGEETGADFTIDNLDSNLSEFENATRITSASNAEAVVDGLAVQRSDNVFDDVIPGISFTAQAVSSEISFTVSRDAEETKANLQEFIDSYNAVVGFINEQNEYSEDDGAGGVLFGDSALYSIQRAISSALFDVDITTVQNDTAGFSTLGLVGVDLQDDGTLALDETTFDAKLAEDPDALQALFSDEESGLLVRLDTAISDLTDSTTSDTGLAIDGLFDRRRETLNTLIDNFQDQIERLEYALEKSEETLVAQFARLEQLTASLNAQGQFLAQGLNFPNNNSN